MGRVDMVGYGKVPVTVPYRIRMPRIPYHADTGLHDTGSALETKKMQKCTPGARRCQNYKK
jgi:hypothetical protein